MEQRTADTEREKNQMAQKHMKREERQMSEAVVVIVLAAFLFGMIMGLCLGKANK